MFGKKNFSSRFHKSDVNQSSTAPVSTEPDPSTNITPINGSAPEDTSVPVPAFSFDRQGDKIKATLCLSKRRLLAGLLFSLLLVLTLSSVASSRIQAAEAAAFESGQTAGYDTGYAEGQALGYESGQDEGYTSGYTAGKDEGYASGYTAGQDEGYSAGYEEGYSAGSYDEGYASGLETGKEEGYASGLEAGKEEGYASGYDAGKEEGYASGYSTGLAEGKASAGGGSSGGNSVSADDADTVGGTVYVSRNGKIHTDPNCSGMKYYTEMSYADAISRGYEKCKKCY